MEISFTPKNDNLDRPFKSCAIPSHEPFRIDNSNRSRRLNLKILECIPRQTKTNLAIEHPLNNGTEMKPVIVFFLSYCEWIGVVIGDGIWIDNDEDHFLFCLRLRFNLLILFLRHFSLILLFYGN